jgi:Concanavalin A-like lectin/glucanases superfamily
MALLVVVMAGLVAAAPVGSVMAIFTKQATVTANTLNTAASFPLCYRDAVMADNPVGYWPLDETSGTSAGDSKNGRNGTYTNGVTLGQSGALPDSINNKAASFDGTNDYVTVPYAAALSPATFTVEAWVKPNGTASWQEVAGSYDSLGGGAYRGYWLGIDGTTWNWEIDNGATITVIEGATVVTGSWTHLVGTFDGTTGKLYVNGTVVASSAATYAANANSPFAIGSTYYRDTTSWSDAFNGAIDEVALYNTALTATQIRTHYNTGRCYKDSVLADAPLGYWRLGEAAGTTAADGIRGRHGTYVGTPTLAATGALNGDSNTAVTFNGTSQYATVPYDSGLNPAQFTVEGWAKPTGGAGTYRTVATSWYEGAAGASPRGYWLGIGTDNKWWLSIANGTTFTNIIGPTVTLNSWAHAVGTYDGTTGRLYLNGILVASTAVSYAANLSAPFGIGAYWANGSWVGLHLGSLDEVALYGTALSSSRVQAHYLLGRSYKDTVLDSGPVSYWRLGEAAGTSAADSKGTNTGTYTNGPTLAQPGALAGESDTSAGFDGSNDYVNVPYTAALNPAQFTVEAWAQPTGSGNWYEVASSWSNSGARWTGYALEINPSNNWVTYLGDGSHTEPLAVGPARILNTWTHVAATYDGATLRLYVNGTLAASTSTTFYAANNSPVPFQIGTEYANGTRSAFFAGIIDDVAVYNRALSATEIQLHYDSGRQ